MGQPISETCRKVREEIREACRNAGRKPDSVRLLAVSKFQPASAIREAVVAGELDFGENYVQEALAKRAELSDLPQISWDLIGHVQSRKAAQIAGRFNLVHTLDSTGLADKLEHHLNSAKTKQKILLEVNIAEEPQKAGISPREALSLAEHVLQNCPHLELRGLMCLPPMQGNNGGASRPYFAQLRMLRDNMEKELGIAFPELSMGMSGDFTHAIMEGATIVRIGTKIFGPRPLRQA